MKNYLLEFSAQVCEAEQNIIHYFTIPISITEILFIEAENIFKEYNLCDW